MPVCKPMKKKSPTVTLTDVIDFKMKEMHATISGTIELLDARHGYNIARNKDGNVVVRQPRAVRPGRSMRPAIAIREPSGTRGVEIRLLPGTVILVRHGQHVTEGDQIAEVQVPDSKTRHLYREFYVIENRDGRLLGEQEEIDGNGDGRDRFFWLNMQCSNLSEAAMLTKAQVVDLLRQPTDPDEDVPPYMSQSSHGPFTVYEVSATFTGKHSPSVEREEAAAALAKLSPRDRDLLKIDPKLIAELEPIEDNPFEDEDD